MLNYHVLKIWIKNKSKVNIVKKNLDHDKQSHTDVYKNASKKLIQKTVGTTGVLVGNKIADKVRTTSPSKFVTLTQTKNTAEKLLENAKKIYIYHLKKEKKNINKIRLIWYIISVEDQTKINFLDNETTYEWWRQIS